MPLHTDNIIRRRQGESDHTIQRTNNSSNICHTMDAKGAYQEYLLGQTGLLYYWSFDNSAPTTRFGGIDLTSTNAPTYVTGKVGTAAQFDGLNDCLYTSSALSMSAYTKIAVSFWWYIDVYDTTTAEVAIEYGTALAASQFYIVLNGLLANDPMEAAIGPTSSGESKLYNDATFAWSTPAWHHMLVVMDTGLGAGSQVSVYRNGALITPSSTRYSNNVSYNWGSYVLYIAARNNAQFFANHTIDELAIFNASGWTDADVAAAIYASYSTDTRFIVKNSELAKQVTFDVYGKSKIGDIDGGNYTEIEGDGTLEFIGNATTWNDIRIEPVARTTGANAPSFEKYYDDAAGTSRGVYLYSFDDAVGGSEKEIFFTMQMPHDWSGTAITPHVHWVGAVDDISSGTASPRWGLEYAWANLGTVYSDTSVIYSLVGNITGSATATGVVANTSYISSFGELTPTSSQAGLSSILIGRVFRDSANAADTYDVTGAKCGMLYIDCHYQQNTIGSRQQYVK